jgi:ubiquinone/menaquinone biosynthesis C-methylase UbiE
MLDPQPRERLIDLGSGLGGPARWIAANFDCHMTGIDLMPEYCEAARALTEAAGLADRVDIHQGSALETPFTDASFDRAYSQNVVMNIADKIGFFREAYRLLKPGGVFAMSNLGAGPNGPHYYPSMWAATADDSFLSTVDETRADLEAAGFDILVLEDTGGGNLAEVDATIK